VVDEYPAFSPDGKTIAFARVAKASGGIYTVNPNGSRLKRLTAPPQGFWDSEPSWSPDGTKIVFTREGAHSEPNAFIMNADGTRISKLATKMGTANSPSFSPDGKKIAFVGAEGSTDKLYLMNADGTNVRRFTKTPSAIWEEAPDWQPLP
jgi:TolB protein